MIGGKRVYEAVDDRLRRHSFPLRVPGVSAFQLAAAVRGAASVDPARLEAILLGLHDETRLGRALKALVTLRPATDFGVIYTTMPAEVETRLP